MWIHVIDIKWKFVLQLGVRRTQGDPAFHNAFISLTFPSISVILCTTRFNIKKLYMLLRKNLLSSSLLSNNLKVKIYRTISLTVGVYGCETWSLTLREERRLREFENRVLRRIFGPKGDEVIREWRKLHNEELNDLYSSHNRVRVIKSIRMRWAGHVARTRERRGVYRVLVGKPEGKSWHGLDSSGSG